MIVKNKFELVYSKDGDVFNVLPIRSHTLEAFKIPNEDTAHLKILATAYGRSRGGTDFVSKNLDACSIVRMEKYPLPAFLTEDGIPVINISILPGKYVSDFSSSDIYALFLYSLLLKIFIIKKPFKKDIEDDITNLFIYVFMKLFGKKHGLLGSYKEKIPTLKSILSLYVNTSMMGNKLDTTLLNKVSNKYFINVDELDLSEDITSTIGMLKLIKINDVIPLSENSFSSTIIKLLGVSSLPVFEDVSRFYATISASSVGGNTIFSSYFKKTNQKLFDKIIYTAMFNAR